MKTVLFKNLNGLGTKAALLGLALTLGASTTGLAKSALASVSLQPQWPTNSQPGRMVLYTVTVSREGEGELEVNLSSAGLPPGATASFSLNPVRFTGRTPTTLTSTVAITCTNLTATDNWPFTITATDKRGTTSITNALAQDGNFSPAAQATKAPNLALDRLSRTSMRLRGMGASGQTYQVQCTRSLSTPLWTPAGSSTADGNGRFTFLDNNTNPPAALFYRVVLPTP